MRDDAERFDLDGQPTGQMKAPYSAKLEVLLTALVDRRARDADRKVLGRLVDHADPKDGTSCPSAQLIADKLDIDVRSVRRSIKRLEDLSYFVTKERDGTFDKDGKPRYRPLRSAHGTTLYKFGWEHWRTQTKLDSGARKDRLSRDSGDRVTHVSRGKRVRRHSSQVTPESAKSDSGVPGSAHLSPLPPVTRVPQRGEIQEEGKREKEVGVAVAGDAPALLPTDALRKRALRIAMQRQPGVQKKIASDIDVGAARFKRWHQNSAKPGDLYPHEQACFDRHPIIAPILAELAAAE